MKCQCGATLLDRGSNFISQAEADLLDILRLKVMGLSARASCIRLPTRELHALTLRCLVQLINTLGKCQVEAQNETNLADSQRIVHSAAKVLADWPDNFFRLLERLTENIPSNSYMQLAQGPVSGIYYLAAMCIQPTEHAQFLRNALSYFSAIHGGRTFKHGDSKQRAGSEHPRRFISIAEFAQQHGITPQTVARYVKTGQIPSIHAKRGNFQAIDCSRVLLHRKSPGKIYGLEIAAKLIGIPIRVLRALKPSGEFEVRHLPHIMPGLHELDVQSFIEKLMNLANPQKSNQSIPQETVCFNLIASSHYGPYSRIDVKTNIIHRLLSKHLPVIGCIDGTVGGLLLSKHDLQNCTRDGLALL